LKIPQDNELEKLKKLELLKERMRIAMADKFRKINQDLQKEGNRGIGEKFRVENARDSTGKFQEGIASPMGSIAQESELVPK